MKVSKEHQMILKIANLLLNFYQISNNNDGMMIKVSRDFAVIVLLEPLTKRMSSKTTFSVVVLVVVTVFVAVAVLL